MLDPAAMIQADKAMKRHILSARPDAPVVPDPPPKRPNYAIRRRMVFVLRRLADRLEPRTTNACASNS
jgi:hypothetical protein